MALSVRAPLFCHRNYNQKSYWWTVQPWITAIFDQEENHFHMRLTTTTIIFFAVKFCCNSWLYSSARAPIWSNVTQCLALRYHWRQNNSSLMMVFEGWEVILRWFAAWLLTFELYSTKSSQLWGVENHTHQVRDSNERRASGKGSFRILMYDEWKFERRRGSSIMNKSIWPTRPFQYPTKV